MLRNKFSIVLILALMLTVAFHAGQLMQINKALVEKNTEIENKNQEMRLAQAKLENVRSELVVASKNLINRKKNLTRLAREVKESIDVRNTVEKQIFSFNNRIKLKNSEVTGLEKKLLALEEAVMERQQILGELTSHQQQILSHIRKRKEDLSSTLNELDKKVSELNSTTKQVQAAMMDYNLLKNKIDVKTEGLMGLNVTMQRKRQQNDILDKKIEDAKENLNSFNMKILDAKGASKLIEKEVDKLENEKFLLSEKNNSLYNEVKKTTQHLQDVSTQVVNVEVELKQKKNQLLEANNRAAELVLQIGIISEQVEYSEERLNLLNTKILVAEQSHNVVKGEVSGLHNTKMQLLNEVQSKKNKISITSQKLQDVSIELIEKEKILLNFNEQIIDVEKRSKQLNLDIQKSKKTADVLENEIEAQKVKKHKLNRDLTNQRSNLKALRAEYEKTASNLVDVRARLAEIKSTFAYSLFAGALLFLK